jgi:hypothetical protein
MGLLDDAIREHLDLQRRRGADPTEVERAEREALGPVRRAPEAAAEAESNAEAAADPEVAYEHEAESEPGVAYDHEDEDESSWSHAPLESEPADAHGQVEDDDPFAELPPPASAPSSHGEPSDDGTWSESPAAPPRPHAADGRVSDETVEYDVEEALGSDGGREGAPSDDDVLEETPEFLQDTPDHDRLWFEQRPPKDFDFDG